jgi:DNA repair protein RAD5
MTFWLAGCRYCWWCCVSQAHNVRNRATVSFKAVMALRAHIRWCLTGTPIVNRANDAQPYMAFLRV